MDSGRIIAHQELRFLFQLWKDLNLKKAIVYNSQESCSYITYTTKPRSNKHKSLLQFLTYTSSSLKMVRLSKLQQFLINSVLALEPRIPRNWHLSLLKSSCPSKWVELLTFSPLQRLLITEWPPAFSHYAIRLSLIFHQPVPLADKKIKSPFVYVSWS